MRVKTNQSKFGFYANKDTTSSFVQMDEEQRYCTAQGHLSCSKHKAQSRGFDDFVDILMSKSNVLTNHLDMQSMLTKPVLTLTWHMELLRQFTSQSLD